VTGPELVLVSRIGLGKRTALQLAEELRFVSGHRFSDAVTRLISTAPLGAECIGSTFSEACLAVPLRANVRALQFAEESISAAQPLKGRDFEQLTASLKRCPDTKPEFY
jgi:hypothetical protein